jgi:hypothetical protein
VYIGAARFDDRASINRTPYPESIHMAKKKAPTSSVLLFKREWIFDPGPDVLNLNRAGLSRVNQLKTDFTKQVNAVIKGSQG